MYLRWMPYLVTALLSISVKVLAISGPNNSNTGNYEITYSSASGLGPASIKEYKNGSYVRTFHVFNSAGSKSVSVSSTAEYRYEHWAEGPCILRDRVTGVCLERGDNMLLGTHTVNVAFKPNTPSTISYSNVENGGTDTNGQFSISWSASSEPPSVSGYQWCQKTNGSWQSIGSCPKVGKGTRSRSLPASGALPTGQYQYRVRAYAKAGNYYQYSGWRTSTAIAVAHLPNPVQTWLQPEGDMLPGTSFPLSWSPVADPHSSDPVTHYQLQWSINDGNFNWVPFTDPDKTGSNLGKTTSVTISEAETGQEIVKANYRFRVRACNGSGCSAAWLTIELKEPDLAAPGEAGGIDAPSLDEDGSYQISWNPVDFATYYKVREKFNGNAWSSYVSTGENPSWSVSDNLNGKYIYGIVACNANECGPESFSSPVIVDSSPGTSVIYIHTDLLGSPVAESDEFGEVQ